LFCFLKRKEVMMETAAPNQSPALQQASVSQRRDAMPIVAAFIDQCRVQFGAAVVDAQLAKAQQARREYLQVLSTQGQAAADHWHRANAHRCTFYAEEGGRTLGLPSPWGV
jgi:hypothetical protein